MPQTRIQKHVEGNELSSYKFVSYREFALQGSVPVNLHGFVIGADNVTRSRARVIEQCENAVAPFKPQAGHDYEVPGSYVNNRRQFNEYDLKSIQQVPVSEQRYSCPEKSWKFW